MSTDKEEMAYIGVAPCGCWVAATCAEQPERVAKYLSDWVMEGLTIERVTVEQVRKSLNGCQCKKPAEARP